VGFAAKVLEMRFWLVISMVVAAAARAYWYAAEHGIKAK
jgi:hypothetical protein